MEQTIWDSVGVVDIVQICTVLKLKDKNLHSTNSNWILIPEKKWTYRLSCPLEKMLKTFEEDKLISPNGTIISDDVFRRARSIMCLLQREEDLLDSQISVYELWDENKKEFRKDVPVLVKSSNYATLIAPIVEDK